MTSTDRHSTYKITLIGSGNVATRLGIALRDAGYDVCGVYSPTESSRRLLANTLGCKALERIEEIDPETDLALIAVTDRAVATAAATIPPIRGVVAHTSGSVSIDALTATHARAGVLYPLQTFSKDVEVDVSRVPFFIEGSDEASLESLRSVGKSLSDTVHEADSSVRAKLHVAGVLSCNFPVYLLEMTRRVLSEAGLPLSTVEPLVEVSMAKAFAVGPKAAMTGPARRGDTAVICKQEASLGSDIHKQIYHNLSQAILTEFHPDKRI